MIETRLLQQFIAVAEHQNMHRAAAALHMAQPPLSQAIKRLEDRLGFALFVRTPKGMQLTTAGQAFLNTAQTLLADLNQGVSHARLVAAGKRGQLVVTALALAQYPALLQALKQFQDQHPQAQLIIKEQASALQQQALLNGEADIAFLRPLQPHHNALNQRLWASEHIVLALPQQHPLAQASSVRLSDFATSAFIFSPAAMGPQHRQTLLDYCTAAGFNPLIGQEVTATSTILALVGSGFGVALVSDAFAHAQAHPRVVFKTIDPIEGHTQPSLTLHVGWHQDNSNPLLQAFLAQLNLMP
ncbi:MAG: LysR family transcriptional regulator [Neisseriaceae bacterium]|nr:LysR family transcriptional regulator [Neisseriaceae bacterium]